MRKISILLLAVLLVVVGSTVLLAGPESRSDAPWMGVLLGGRKSAAESNVDGRQGVVLNRIFNDSPAARSGLRARDVIVAVDGSPTTSSRQLMERIREFDPGDWIPLSVLRNGQERQIRLRLSTRPDKPSSDDYRKGWIGLKWIDLPSTLREHFGAPSDAGLMISEIAPGSPSESAGLRVGDVIHLIGEDPVRSGRDLARNIQGGGVGNRVEIGAMRDGVEIVVEAMIEQKPPTEHNGR